MVIKGKLCCAFRVPALYLRLCSISRLVLARTKGELFPSLGLLLGQANCWRTLHCGITIMIYRRNVPGNSSGINYKIHGSCGRSWCSMAIRCTVGTRTYFSLLRKPTDLHLFTKKESVRYRKWRKDISQLPGEPVPHLACWETILPLRLPIMRSS